MGKFVYESLSDRELITAVEGLQLDFEIPIETTEGYVNTPIAILKSFIIQSLDQRVTSLELGGGGGVGGVWSTPRTLTLTGAVSGSVEMDGSQNVSMTTSIGAGALPMSSVDQLTPTLAAQAANIDRLYLPYRELSANDTLAMGDIVTALSASGPFSLQLPTINLATDTRPITVYRRGANPITILKAAGQTIEGGVDDLLMDLDNSSVVLAPSSATNWRICNRVS